MGQNLDHSSAQLTELGGRMRLYRGITVPREVLADVVEQIFASGLAAADGRA